MNFSKFPIALITVGLICFGGMKVSGNEQIIQSMEKLNYSEAFTRVLGLGELVLAVSLWHKKTKHISILFLFGIFSGAVGSHLAHGDGISAAAPALVFLVATGFGFSINLSENSKQYD